MGDLDADGDQDFLLGGSNSAPVYIKNTGSASSPQFTIGIGLHLLFHYPPDRERGLPVLLVLIFGLLLLVFGGTLLVKINRWQHNPRAVVLSSVALRSAPAAGRTLKELVPATTVTVKTETPIPP